ncbi:MAG TPA: trypsin-like peptidase domain-containing protein, partial [Isosphaeraceae bacterium]|nr:trypsin-like peptidase domain-containing protein [Isosphaeraceae bacterium]
MARVVICPTCQSKGSVPDQAQVDKIRCPRCGTVFPLGFAAGSRQPSAASSAPAQAAVSGSGMRRSSAAGGSGPAGRPILLYTTLAVSGLAVILLGAVVVLLVSRGGGAGGQAAAPVAVAEPAPAKGAESEATAPQASTINRTALTAVSGETSVAATPAPSLATPVAPIAATPAAIDPQEIIRRVKDAAVYIKNKVGGRTISSGSGFVIEVNGDTVVVATNRHVAVADLSELPPGLVSPGTLPTIEAVFRSGQGKDEQALPAQILAADLSEEMNVDLAFLIVKGVSRPPSPIDPMVRIQPAEGMVYIGAGFPLGGLLSKVTESQGNPSVTITGGRIAALRRNAYGQLAVLQVDGSLQPGNSGGP